MTAAAARPSRTLPAVSDRIRVAMMVDQLRAGGAERFAVALAAELDRSRFEVTMIAARAGSWPEEREHLLRHGVSVLQLGRRSTAHVSPWAGLRRFLRERRIDVFHAHKFGSNVWGSLVGRLARVPVVIATEHSWSFEGQAVRRLLDRHLVGRLADVTVAVSEADRRRMMSVEGLPGEQVRVIPTGLVPPLVSVPDPRFDLRAEIGAPPGAVLVATVCQLRPEKAIDVLLEAHRRAAAEAPCHLVVIGDGPDRERLEAVADRLGRDGVHFLGQRFDVLPLLRQCDVFALSSDREGSPLALVEGMAAGLAPVATNVGGVPEIAPEGEVALLVPPRDPEALGAALARVVSDAAERARLAAAAERRAAEYAFPRIVERWQDLYVETLAARGGPA